MLAQQRQSAILDLVRRQGGVHVADLSRQFGVSDMTIRRDLDALAGRLLINKVHGGAVAANPGSPVEPGFAAKSALARAEKAAIAARAAALVEPGAAIALSPGTTTAALAALLTDVPRLTVLTNSIPVADTLHRAGHPDQTVILSGGVRTPSDALVGPVADAAIAALNVDILFLGIHGMSEEAGFSTPNLLEAATSQRLVAAARRVVVLADHAKWGTVGIATIAPLTAADILISDAGLPDDAAAALTELVGELILVAGVDQ